MFHWLSPVRGGFACPMGTDLELRLEATGGTQKIAGVDSSACTTANEYLGYLIDRNYSPSTVRANGFDRFAF